MPPEGDASFNAQVGFSLERLSGIIRADVAAGHCPIEQPIDQRSGPTVPLVLGGATGAMRFERLGREHSTWTVG